MSGMSVPVAVLVVATVLATAAAAAAGEPPAAITALVRAEAHRHGLDPRLVLSVIRVESNFVGLALSPKGAMGLMQLMPATARRFGVTDPWDPAQNIRGGCAYLRFLIGRYDGDMRLVFAAYNAGEGAVDGYDGVPPYAETRAYVAKLTGGSGGAGGRVERAVTATGHVVEWRERGGRTTDLFDRPSGAGR